MTNQDIAQAVAIELAAKKLKTPSKGWRFGPGVVLFPEARCPFCKEIVKSKAIWLVTKTQLLGQVAPVDGRELKLDAPRHPHATPSEICFGNATDPLQALFGGLNPDSQFIDTANWLKGKYWDHSCDEIEEDRRHEFPCVDCEEYYSNDESYNFDGESYCESCFYNIAFYCYNCSESCSINYVYKSPSDCDYCESCWRDCFFTCTGCDETFKLSECFGEGKCEDCYESPPTCSVCEGESKTDPCGSCAGDAECDYCGDSYHSYSVDISCSQCNERFCDEDCKRLHTRWDYC